MFVLLALWAGWIQCAWESCGELQQERGLAPTHTLLPPWRLFRKRTLRLCAPRWPLPLYKRPSPLPRPPPAANIVAAPTPNSRQLATDRRRVIPLR